MVPVQHYLFQELWNKTRRRDWLAYFYPRLRQYYLFYSGKAEGSTTNALGSNLLKTWDYFYNSGGWDDYPAQAHVHRHGLQASAAPVITTCHAIRIAKILTLAARELGGLAADEAEYAADIARFAEAVERHAWDEASGYYGYVVHDGGGKPAGILRHESGANFNMGFDGVYPLVAGECGRARGAVLLERLNDERRLRTPIGLTAVDRSAPYYREDGYWNGTVWMAHQWFFWKTMLDLGRADDAWRIASTALALWERETRETYNAFEHFTVAAGRGAGWHQFGGLSAPVLDWFGAYFRAGRATGGFDVWMRRCEFSPDLSRAELEWVHVPNGTADAYTILIGLRPDCEYTVTETGGLAAVSVRMRHGGLLELTVPASLREARVVVRPRTGGG